MDNIIRMEDQFIDMEEMYYPSDDEAEESLYLFTALKPDSGFQCSWSTNGHGLRLDPGIAVTYVATFPKSDHIIRNGHGHPKIISGTVLDIIDADQCVRIKPSDSSNEVIIHWDMVVSREDNSTHRSLPLALTGTNEDDIIERDPRKDNSWMFHRTLEVGPCLKNQIQGMKDRHILRVLEENSMVSEPVRKGTLAALAFESLKDGISTFATQKRCSFFTAASGSGLLHS
jgi:hypothetical protein